MKLLYKIRASVLQFAILVAVLVALLLLSYISLTHTQKVFSLQSSQVIERVDAVQQGLDNYLLLNSSAPQNTSLIKEIKIESNFWGGYERVSCFSTTEQISKTALVGKKTQQEKVAVFLPEANNSLVLVGDTQIEGTAYLPQKGVKAGTIAGRYYNGEQLIYGQIRNSDAQLLPLMSDFISYIKSELKGPDYQNMTGTSRQAEIKNSFNNKTLLISDSDRIELSEKAIGNVKYQSKKEIIVKPESYLEDVLLVAPIIRIEKGFTGRVHAIASDSIIIEQDVHLQYPSSLVLLKDIASPIQTSSCITLKDNSLVEGTLLYLENEQSEKSLANIHLSEKATLKGSVYCQGNIELQGTVVGSVYTKQFLVIASGGIYVNHILGGKILSQKAPEEFCGLPLAKEVKGVAQWLY